MMAGVGKMMAEMIPALVLETSRIPEKKVPDNVVHPECRAVAEEEVVLKENVLVMMVQVVILKMVTKVQVVVGVEAGGEINHPEEVDEEVVEAEAIQTVNSQMGQVVQVDTTLGM